MASNGNVLSLPKARHKPCGSGPQLPRQKQATAAQVEADAEVDGEARPYQKQATGGSCSNSANSVGGCSQQSALSQNKEITINRQGLIDGYLSESQYIMEFDTLFGAEGRK